MKRTPSFLNKPPPTRQILTKISPVEELMAFLKLYLDPYTANKIESEASKLEKNPDTNITRFIREVNRAIQTHLDSEEEGIKREIIRTINRYRDEMVITDDCVKGKETSAHHIGNDKIRNRSIKASKRLVKQLDSIIPEAKRASLLRKANHLSKKELQTFLAELEEVVFDFCENKNLQIKENLDFVLDSFENDMLILSSLRIMVSKMDVLKSSLEREDVLPEIKAALNDKTEMIKSKLMAPTLSLTPEDTQDIVDLAKEIKKLARNTSNHFKKIAKDFDDTVTFVCYNEPI